MLKLYFTQLAPLTAGGLGKLIRLLRQSRYVICPCDGKEVLKREFAQFLKSLQKVVV